jgi:hypothetical protein
MGILAECPSCHTRQSTKNKKCIGLVDKKKQATMWLEFRYGQKK